MSTNGTYVNGAKACHGVASIESGFWLSILEAHFVVFIPFRGETQADYECHVKRSVRERETPCVREKPRPPTSKTSVVQMMGKQKPRPPTSKTSVVQMMGKWTGECIESEHPEMVRRIVHDNGKLCLAKSFRCPGGDKNEVKLWQLFDQAERLHPGDIWGAGVLFCEFRLHPIPISLRFKETEALEVPLAAFIFATSQPEFLRDDSVFAKTMGLLMDIPYGIPFLKNSLFRTRKPDTPLSHVSQTNGSMTLALKTPPTCVHGKVPNKAEKDGSLNTSARKEFWPIGDFGERQRLDDGFSTLFSY
ncbi:hypothetical protein MMC22_008203 [Lobaria immixta]|nr:hypothetical protein [Lobaria immixta]